MVPATKTYKIDFGIGNETRAMRNTINIIKHNLSDIIPALEPSGILNKSNIVKNSVPNKIILIDHLNFCSLLKKLNAEIKNAAINKKNNTCVYSLSSLDI